ncbi:Poly(A) RNA polymerase gld-2 [Diplonema papillatum]|nr:Poly(A) RNA polymerase gld-2 [Diplonema papillatum]
MQPRKRKQMDGGNPPPATPDSTPESKPAKQKKRNEGPRAQQKEAEAGAPKKGKQPAVAAPSAGGAAAPRKKASAGKKAAGVPAPLQNGGAAPQANGAARAPEKNKKPGKAKASTPQPGENAAPRKKVSAGKSAAEVSAPLQNGGAAGASKKHKQPSKTKPGVAEDAAAPQPGENAAPPKKASAGKPAEEVPAALRNGAAAAGASKKRKKTGHAKAAADDDAANGLPPSRNPESPAVVDRSKPKRKRPANGAPAVTTPAADRRVSEPDVAQQARDHSVVDTADDDAADGLGVEAKPSRNPESPAVVDRSKPKRMRPANGAPAVTTPAADRRVSEPAVAQQARDHSVVDTADSADDGGEQPPPRKRKKRAERGEEASQQPPPPAPLSPRPGAVAARARDVTEPARKGAADALKRRTRAFLDAEGPTMSDRTKPKYAAPKRDPAPQRDPNVFEMFVDTNGGDAAALEGNGIDGEVDADDDDAQSAAGSWAEWLDGLESDDASEWEGEDDAGELESWQPTQEALDRLSAAIQSYHEDSILSKEASARRDEFVAEIRKHSETMFPEGRLLVFGSSATGLCTHNSDIDVSLLVHPDADPKTILRSLKYPISRFARVQFIQNARVPILKCVGKSVPLQFDVSCNRPEGGWNAAIVRNFLSREPRVSPILFYLHELFARAGIKNSRFQLLSAFSINVSFIHYLQAVAEPSILPYFRWQVPALDSDFRTSEASLNEASETMLKPGVNTDSMAQLLVGYLQWLRGKVRKATSNYSKTDWIDIRHSSDRGSTPRADSGVGMVNPVDGSHNITSNVKRRQWEKIDETLAALCEKLSAATGSLDPTVVGRAVSGAGVVYQPTAAQQPWKADPWAENWQNNKWKGKRKGGHVYHHNYKRPYR